ncbi:MAG TPA: hypothetical protein VLJ57_07515 [Burkholderiaceae bacterium]|nr:hypothetical protein [Burkholderiaceae bacterium]
MAPIRTLAALASLALISACATVAAPAGGPGPAKADEHASHHPADTAAAPAAAPAAAHERMKAMKQMHDKMMNGMGAKPGAGEAGATLKDLAQRQQMLESRMEMMQMAMDMMMQRMPGAAAPASK